jgi:elongation factor 1 alpha-like protein
LKIANKPVDFAIKGDLVQMSFKASQLSNDSIEAFRIGDLISKIGSPVKIVKKLQVQLHLFNLTKPLLVGTPFVLFRNNCQVPARITQLVEVLNGKKKKKLLHLVSKQSAIVDVEVEGTSLPLTKYEDNRILGRIVIRREGITIGAGTVLDFIE